jgi:regulator of nonsense transcripts 1
MEGAFTHVGNHLISDSAAAINAGDDDLSTLDADESLLYGRYGGRGGLSNAARRRNDDDDNETEAADDDDAESLASVPVGPMNGLNLRNTPQEEKKLPPHACAYVLPRLNS